jgi:hypothetical protein
MALCTLAQARLQLPCYAQEKGDVVDVIFKR